MEDTRICVVMVGLPARGKSYIAQKGTYIVCFLPPRISPSQPLHHSRLQFQQLTQYVYRQL